MKSLNARRILGIIATSLAVVAHGNVAMSTRAISLPLVSEDVQVAIRPKAALVKGTFVFSANHIRFDGDEPPIVIHTPNGPELIEMHPMRSLQLEVPIVIGQSADPKQAAPFIQLYLEVNCQVVKTCVTDTRINPVGLPGTVKAIIFKGTAGNVPVTNGRLTVTFSYLQPMFNGFFYYIPVLSEDFEKPAASDGPIDGALRIHVHSQLGKIWLLGEDTSSEPEKDGVVIFPRHLNAIRASLIPKSTKPLL